MIVYVFAFGVFSLGLLAEYWRRDPGNLPAEDGENQNQKERDQ